MSHSGFGRVVQGFTQTHPGSPNKRPESPREPHGSVIEHQKVFGLYLSNVPGLAVCLLIIATVLDGAARCQAQNLFQRPAGGEEVFLLAPRPLVRLLSEGKQAILEGRYTDAVLALGTIVQDDSENLPEDLRGQDFFIEVGRDQLYRKTIQGEALQLLADLPEEGRRVLEIEFGVTARKELEAALGERSLQAVGDVARGYPHTVAAYEAQLIVAHEKLASGYPRSAARLFQDLLQTPAARAKFGSELAKATAVSWAQAGLRSRAVSTLQLATNLFPGGSIDLAGQQIALTDSVNWERVLSGVPELDQSLPQDRPAENWLLAGGSASRNETVKASLPLRNARWVKEIHSSVPEKRNLLELEDAERQSDRAILPKFEIRALGDLVFSKTSDSEVLAIDFETGLTKWPIYLNSSPAKLMNLQFDAGGSRAAGGLSPELVDRVWGSSAYGRFSCDRERLYYISSDATPGANSRTGFAQVESNTLQGFSIAAEGKIEWQVGGNQRDSGDPLFQEAYFLGPPLSYEGDLYAIVEVKGETRLVVMDPASGQVRWYQQLAQPLSSQLKYDPLRRSQALSPTVSEGILVCPTGAGAIVAVDLLTRRLLWGYSYGPKLPRSISQFGRRGGAFGFANRNYQPLDSRWQDTTMIAQDGIVVVSPAESDNYFALSVETGEPLFAPQKRGDARYIAGLRDGNLYIAAEREVYCLSMEDSNIRWIQEYPERLRLAGKGLWMTDGLLLPLTDNTLIKVSLRDGSVVGQAVVDEPLGNLFVHRGNLISASATAVAAFHMRDDLEARVKQRLAEDPQDTWALNHQAQLSLSQGRIEEAYQTLARSFEIDPEDIDTKYLLVETLLSGMGEDFERYQNRADQFRHIVEFGPQRFRFLQWLALGSLRSGDTLGAFGNFMSLMRERVGVIRSSIDSRSSQLKLEKDHTVDVDHWIGTALSRLYETADPEERQEMDLAVRQELDQLSDFISGRRRQTLEYFRWHPTASRDVLDLAMALLKRDDQTRAERLLVPLVESDIESIRETAAKLLAKSTLQDNLRFGPRGQVFSQPLQQPLNPEPESSSDMEDSDHLMQPPEWKTGLVVTKVRQDGPRLYPQGLRLPMVSERWGRPDFDVKLSGGRLIVSNMNGDDVARFEFNRASSDISDEYARVHVRGGLLIVETSSEVFGMDLYRGLNDGREAMLWRQSLLFPSAAPTRRFNQPSRVPEPEMSPFGVPIAIRTTNNRKTAVGPLTPAGLVLQLGNSISLIDAYTGRQLWEREGYDDRVRLAADGLQVAVVNPSVGRVEILDCRDGTLLDQRPYRGDWEEWFAYKQFLVDYTTRPLESPSGAAVRSSRSKQAILRIWNAFTGEELVPPMALAEGTAANVREGRYLVVLEPESTLHFFDLEHGEYRQLETKCDPQLDSIHLERFRNTLVVLSNTDDARGNPYANATFFMKPADGSVHAIDLDSKQLLWKQPGRLQDMMFPNAQPRNSPFMVVYRYDRRRALRNVRRRQEIVAEALAVVDLRTGHLAYTIRDISVGPSDGFAMLLYPQNQSLEFTLGNSNFFLTATDLDRPPQPIFSFGAN